MSVYTSTGFCGRNVTYPLPAFTDNCNATIALTSGPSTSNGSYFSRGVTTVEFTATDFSGNTASCSFTISVLDNEAPRISKPMNSRF